MRRSLVLGVVLASVVAFQALADDVVCVGELGGERIDGDVIVPEGAACSLNGTRVDDNVKVEKQATLLARSARIGGNVQADEAAAIEILEGTRVSGNVQIAKTVDVPAADTANAVCDAQIGGDLQLSGNLVPFEIGCDDGNRIGGNLQVTDHDVASGFSGDALVIRNNQIRANLQLSDNKSASGGFDVSDNRVKQNLQCVDNDPAPQGAGNRVGGTVDEQCASLAQGGNGNGGSKGRTNGDLTCTGEVQGGKFDEVQVPSGELCVLDGAKVSGNVVVESGGALETRDTKVGGNVQTDEAVSVLVGEGTQVHGDVQIDKTSGTPDGGPNQVCGAKIRGNLQVTDGVAAFEIGCEAGNKIKGNLQVQANAIGSGAIAISNNKVGANLQVQDNAADGIDVSDNRVKQNLQCVDNTPAPSGGDNRVKDDAEDQCAELAL